MHVTKNSIFRATCATPHQRADALCDGQWSELGSLYAWNIINQLVAPTKPSAFFCATFERIFKITNCIKLSHELFIAINSWTCTWMCRIQKPVACINWPSKAKSIRLRCCQRESLLIQNKQCNKLLNNSLILNIWLDVLIKDTNTWIFCCHQFILFMHRFNTSHSVYSPFLSVVRCVYDSFCNGKHRPRQKPLNISLAIYALFTRNGIVDTMNGSTYCGCTVYIAQ